MRSQRAPNSRGSGRGGFTLTEIMAALLITGVGVGLFGTVFVNNWSAYEERIRRANMWSEATQLFESMSTVGRNSRVINVTRTPAVVSATFMNADPTIITTFTIAADGTVSRVLGADIKIFSTRAVLADSDFTKNGKDLIVDLVLRDTIFVRNINITAATEVSPRN